MIKEATEIATERGERSDKRPRRQRLGGLGEAIIRNSAKISVIKLSRRKTVNSVFGNLEVNGTLSNRSFETYFWIVPYDDNLKCIVTESL